MRSRRPTLALFTRLVRLAERLCAAVGPGDGPVFIDFGRQPGRTLHVITESGKRLSVECPPRIRA